MRARWRGLITAAGIVAVFGAAAAAQTPTGSISGTVKDTTGGLLPGAEVTVTAADNSLQRRIVTNSDGRFRIAGLLAGTYRLDVHLPGFRRAVDQVTVSADKTIEWAVALRPGIIQMADYGIPSDSLLDALHRADVVAHVRILESPAPRLLGPFATILATEHRATILASIKGQAGSSTLQFFQPEAGVWYEDGQRYIGENKPYPAGSEHVAFLRPLVGHLLEVAGGAFTFPVVSGTVKCHWKGVPGVRDEMPVAEFVAALQRAVRGG